MCVCLRVSSDSYTRQTHNHKHNHTKQYNLIRAQQQQQQPLNIIRFWSVPLDNWQQWLWFIDNTDWRTNEGKQDWKTSAGCRIIEPALKNKTKTKVSKSKRFPNGGGAVIHWGYLRPTFGLLGKGSKVGGWEGTKLRGEKDRWGGGGRARKKKKKQPANRRWTGTTQEWKTKSSLIFCGFILAQPRHHRQSGATPE